MKYYMNFFKSPIGKYLIEGCQVGDYLQNNAENLGIFFESV